MKIITKDNRDEILLDDIKQTHVVVGIINNDPVFLTQDDYRSGKFYWLILHNSTGNTYGGLRSAGYSSIKEALERHPSGTFEVFDSWSKALIWLLNNQGK